MSAEMKAPGSTTRITQRRAAARAVQLFVGDALRVVLREPGRLRGVEQATE
jgi:hypothetical protein